MKPIGVLFRLLGEIKMLTKQSAEILLKILAQPSAAVSPMAPRADENYMALAQARNELIEIIRGAIEEPKSE